MGEKLRPEDCVPPSKQTIDLIVRNVGNRWPGTDVEVFYAWVGDSSRLYLKWMPEESRHKVVPKFKPDVQRIVCWMSYGIVLDEIASLSCDMCNGEGVLPCSRCKGAGKTKAGGVCTRCAGNKQKTCPNCVKAV